MLLFAYDFGHPIAVQGNLLTIGVLTETSAATGPIGAGAPGIGVLGDEIFRVVILGLTLVDGAGVEGMVELGSSALTLM